MKSLFDARYRCSKDNDVLLVPLTGPEDVFFCPRVAPIFVSHIHGE